MLLNRDTQEQKPWASHYYWLRPDISWSKGHAVLWLLEALNLRNREDIITVYIGDDTTDEDAFKVFLVSFIEHVCETDSVASFGVRFR